MAETTIGALAVRIGADASQLISELNKADKALKAKEVTFKNVSKAAAAYGAAVSAAGVAVFAFVKSVSNSADELGKMSQKVGVSVESLSALKHAAALSDVSMESLAQGLKILSRNMAETHAGTGEAKDAFRALGISVADSSGKMKVTDQMLLDLAEKFEGMEDGAGKTALAMKIFGKSGADLIPLLNQGRAGIEEMKKEAERLGIVISKETAAAAEKFNDNVTRLKGATEGLAIAMAGPLVKAFGEATDAMLEAHKKGESFLSMLARGWQLLATGTDADKFNKQFVEATDRYINAQNLLDQARATYAQTQTPFDADQVKRFSEELKVAKAELDRLTKIKPILLGEDKKPDGKDKKKKKVAPTLLTSESAGDAARAAKQIEEGEEEFREQSRQAWELYHQYLRGVTKDTTHQIITDHHQLSAMVESEGVQLIRDQTGNVVAAIQEVERESVEGLRRAAEERNAIMIAAFDAEEELAIERGQRTMEADGLSHALKLEALRTSMLAEDALLNEQHARRLEELNKFTDAELEALGGRQAVIERMTEEHEERLAMVKKRHSSLNLAAAKTFLGHMSALMDTNSKKMFEIGKAAAIAETVINTSAAAMGAYKAMASIPYVGPALGAAAAAAAIAAGAAQISAIRSQQVGGGGSAPSAVGTFSANPSTGQPTGTPGGDVGGGGERARGPDTIIQLPGVDTVSTESVRRLLERLNETVRDGGRITIV